MQCSTGTAIRKRATGRSWADKRLVPGVSFCTDNQGLIKGTTVLQTC